MKNLFKILFAFLAVAMIGCTEEEDGSTGAEEVLTFNTSEAGTSGFIRAGIDYSQITEGDLTFYVTVPFLNTTGYIQKVNIVDQASNSQGFSVAATELSVNPGSLSLKVALQEGYISQAGRNVTLAFDITNADGEILASVEKVVTAMTMDYEVDAISYSSVVANADFRKDYSVMPSGENEKATVSFKYKNGWAKTTSFYIVANDLNHTFTLVGAESVTLADYDTETSLEVEITGEYISADASCKVDIIDGDGNDVGSFTVSPTDKEDVVISSVSYTGSGFVVDEVPTLSTLDVTYTYGYSRTITADVTITDADGTTVIATGTGLTVDELAFGMGENTASIDLSGITAIAPATASEATISVTLNHADFTDAVTNTEATIKVVSGAETIISSAVYTEETGFVYDVVPTDGTITVTYTNGFEREVGVNVTITDGDGETTLVSYDTTKTLDAGATESSFTVNVSDLTGIIAPVTISDATITVTLTHDEFTSEVSTSTTAAVAYPADVVLGDLTTDFEREDIDFETDLKDGKVTVAYTNGYGRSASYVVTVTNDNDGTLFYASETVQTLLSDGADESSFDITLGDCVMSVSGDYTIKVEVAVDGEKLDKSITGTVALDTFN